MASSSSSSSSSAPIPTSAVLTCASKHIQSACSAAAEAFTACKSKAPGGRADPHSCASQAKALTGCTLKLLKELNGSEQCSSEFNAYAACMDYNSNEFKMCRREQRAFEAKCPSSSVA